MRRFHFYHKDNGTFADFTVYTDDAETAKANAPPDHVMIEGEFDVLSQRMDLSGEKPVVVEHRPPAPSAGHEWDVNTKRWEPSAAMRRRESAFVQIRALELGQARAVREFLLGHGGDGRLREIDEQISRLRAQL